MIVTIVSKLGYNNLLTGCIQPTFVGVTIYRIHLLSTMDIPVGQGDFVSGSIFCDPAREVRQN